MFNLSFSTLNNYRKSPLQFYFEKIAKPNPTDEVNQGYGIAGNVVHDCCEMYINGDKNYVGLFHKLWDSKMKDQRVFNGAPFDKQRYLDMLEACVGVINSMHSQKVQAEKKFLFPINNPQAKIKGFVDVISKEEGGVVLYDWKTNVSMDREQYEEQRLFYSWMCWKRYGFIPKECRWYYAAHKEFITSKYTEEEIIAYDKEITRVLLEIQAKGDDINNYEVGDYDSPFNVYKTACAQVDKKRNNNVSFSILSWGNYSLLKGEITRLLQKGLVQRLSYEKENAHFIRKNSNWDGIVRFFNHRKNSFPTGLRDEAIKVLNEYASHLGRKLVLEINDMTNFTGMIDVPDKLVGVELRDYQLEAVEAFMKKKYSTIKMFTGLGKTVTAAEIIRRACTNTLWVINRKLLLEQTKEVLEEVLGVKVGTIIDGEFNPEEITICTYQTLAKRAKEVKDYLGTIGLLVLDEVHGAGNKSVKEICFHCANTQYRLGLSATPDLKNDYMEVRALVGDICYEASEEQAKNFLSESIIKFIELADDRCSSTARDYNNAYENYIVFNDVRNDKIVDLVKKHKGQNILIITKLVKHAELLADKLGVPSLLGLTTKEEREAIVDGYKQEGGFVCVGSVQIVSEGWNVTNMDVIIQASAPASAVKTIQGLGRVLRKHEGKELAYYYDFVDRHERFFRAAAYKRKRALEEEGHEIFVVRE